MYATIQKWGNSNAIRIPKSIMETVQLSENDKIEIITSEIGIIIKKAKPKYTSLDDLFADYHGDYKCSEMDVGSPVGKEVL